MNRILVGVDASEDSADALRLAADVARATGASLEVLHAYEPHEHVMAFPVPADRQPEADRDELERQLGQRLAEWLDATGVDLAGLEVATTVVPDTRPSRALVERSEQADLLVVAKRGRGGFRGLRIGSVTDQIVRHAACPVLVAPGRRERGEG